MSVFIIKGRCPQCGQPSELSPSNPARPFCSERCKLIDFEGWVSGRFTIPAEDDEQDHDEPPGKDLEH